MKSGVSPQKTPIWTSICTPVAQSLLNSSGHSPRLGRHNFRLGGTSSHFEGHGPGMPPRGAGSAPVPSPRGGQGGRAPLTTACAPLLFWFTQITVFETSRNRKTTTMMVKGATAFKHNFPLKVGLLLHSIPQ